jgi:hypothetical protein
MQLSLNCAAPRRARCARDVRVTAAVFGIISRYVRYRTGTSDAEYTSTAARPLAFRIETSGPLSSAVVSATPPKNTSGAQMGRGPPGRSVRSVGSQIGDVGTVRSIANNTKSTNRRENIASGEYPLIESVGADV